MIDEEFMRDYNEVINSIARETLKGDLGLIKILKEKRDFGLKKYGEISFQANPINAMSVDTLTHAKEEIIDLINYLLHEYYKNEATFSIHKHKKLKKMIKKSHKMYREIGKLQNGII